MKLRKTLRVARWEVTKGAGGIDRRNLLVGALGIAFVLAMVPALAGGGFALDEGIYRIGVAESHPLHGPASADPSFIVREPSAEAYEEGNLEILIRGSRATYRDTEKGRAAVATLRESVARYNDARMRGEANETAAFPVDVTIEYVERGTSELVAPGSGGGGDAGGGGGGGDGTGGTGGGTAGGSDGGDTDSRGDDGPFGAPNIGPDLFGTGTARGSPSAIAPPFPFQSLVLAFAFVLPLNFVIQAYGSSMLRERVKRRGELLLVAPVSRGDIIVGKTLPYFLGGIGVIAAIALVAGGGPLSVVAMVPLALLFLAATFLGAMFARSFKELTFVTVTVSVFLTSFAFVPAIFTDIGPIALISPLTLVVRDLAGESVDFGSVAFATLPTTLTAMVLYGLGTGLYREEDLFTQRPVHLKALDALAGRISGLRSLPLLVAVLIPFVFVAELLAVAALFAVPAGLAVPLLFLAIAVIEELAKSLPVYAGFTHARYPRTLQAGALAGALAGLGFFLGEKLTLIVQLVGLPELRTRTSGQIGETAFQTGFGVDGPAAIVILLLAPLALHVVTAGISAAGASRGRDEYAAALTVAILLHLAYNLTVVTNLV
ncbi:ABC transporter permease [Natronomonas sp. EA1]|uniref:ABC transporter permease n=1 Tax=Natronomonas sp. EA1 TaxID=3421655 RepID=UPI003EC07957